MSTSSTKHRPGKRLKQWHRNAMAVDGTAPQSLKAYARDIIKNGGPKEAATAAAWFGGR